MLGIAHFVLYSENDDPYLGRLIVQQDGDAIEYTRALVVVKLEEADVENEYNVVERGEQLSGSLSIEDGRDWVGVHLAVVISKILTR